MSSSIRLINSSFLIKPKIDGNNRNNLTNYNGKLILSTSPYPYHSNINMFNVLAGRWKITGNTNKFMIYHDEFDYKNMDTKGIQKLSLEYINFNEYIKFYCGASYDDHTSYKIHNSIIRINTGKWILELLRNGSPNSLHLHEVIFFSKLDN